MDGLTGVVLLNLGGPDSLDAVEPFLFNLFNDNDIITLPLGGLWLGQRWLARRISRKRAEVVRSYYHLIGDRSPIGEITLAQADGLERRLNARGRGRFRCYVAMRYWHPFTDEALAEMKRDGVTRLVALTLYPHYTTATTGSSLSELRRRFAGKPPGLGAVPYYEIDRFYDHPAYLDALTAQVELGLAGFEAQLRPSVTVLFSAHGLPRSFIRKGDPYVEHLYATIAGVMARLAARAAALQPWRLSFQSRVGSGWLEPDTEATLEAIASEGKREVLVVPISFVSDHIETLYEIDILFGATARRVGLDMRRAPSLNATPEFIEALAQLVEARLGAAGQAQATDEQGAGTVERRGAERIVRH